LTNILVFIVNMLLRISNFLSCVKQLYDFLFCEVIICEL